LIHRIFKGFVLNSYGNFPSDVVWFIESYPIGIL
jgi:hypothetical protein